MDTQRLKPIIEASLMVAEKPLSLDHLIALFGQPDETQPTREEVRAALDELGRECQGRGIELTEVASGYRFQTRTEFAPWINRLWEEKKPRYSRALLETLAIIAYRQPITRGEIEDIRGVAVSTGIVRTLMERQWVRIVGHRDVPGRPALFSTTREFLDYFNLKSLSDLPTLAELKDIDDLNADLFEQDVETGGDGLSTEADPGTSVTPDEEDHDDGTAVLDEADARANDIETPASSGLAAAAPGVKCGSLSE